METENSWSPSKMAVSIGEGPRYFGKREGWILRMPSGSQSLRKSGLKRTPKLARTPWAEGWDCFRRVASGKSALVRAWKIMSQCLFRISRT